MKLYRVQSRWPKLDDDPATAWCADLVEVRKLRRELEKVGYVVKVDQVDVPTNKRGLADALTNAHVDRTQWPGKEVR